MVFVSAMTLVTAASANCPYYNQPHVQYRAAGTEVRRWVTNTNTEWQNSAFVVEIYPGTIIERNQNVEVNQVHTQYWQAEVISRSATVQCAVKW